MKRWIFRDAPPGAPNAAWAEDLGISPTLLNLLWQRGFDTRDDMDAFLSARLASLRPPAHWPGVSEAAALFVRELIQGKKPVIWGDYDVDGITATTIALDVLEAHGIAAGYHIPDRRSEGYGLNVPALERLAAEGYGVLLTVDCGIADVEAIARARELGMTVIVTDHHLPPEELPPAHALCNPRLVPAEECPCPDLAGVGVSFFLMAAINSLLAERTGRRYKMDDALDVTALGTLADVMRLTGQNRVLVRGGLEKIAGARRPGMLALKTVSGLDPLARLTGGQVVFRLAPRINAAGRMGKADIALRLLRCKDCSEAAGLAQTLDTLNTERKQEEERIWAEAREQALQLMASRPRPGLVVYGPDWHPGIIGIVASRLLEEFYCPTIILCDDGESLKGSGRSIREFDLYAGLQKCSDILSGFGGHRQAAGVRLDRDRLEDFRTAFETVCAATLGPDPVQPTLILENELDFATAGNQEFLRELDLLQPFGPGNAEPVFASPPLLIRDRLPLGQGGQHVRLKVQDTVSGVTLIAKAWRMAAEFPSSMIGKRIRIAYTPRIDMYNGIAAVDIGIKDWQPA